MGVGVDLYFSQKRVCVFLLWVWILFLPNESQAKLFRNSYISFQLPSKWSCNIANAVWLCRYAVSKPCRQGPQRETKACRRENRNFQEAVIIFTAKSVGPKDSFKKYYEHLQKPHTVFNDKGRRTESKVIHTKTLSINKQKWLDGMHLASQIPYYYTRYLATIKGNIAIMVSFSAHKMYYTKYSSDFFKSIKSLRIVASKASPVRPSEISKDNGGAFLGGMSSLDLDLIEGEGADRELVVSQGKKSSSYVLFLIPFILMVLGLYLWYRQGS